MFSQTNEKSSDCPSNKFVRRFPETNSNDANNNNRINKSEIQQHHSWANERDSQPTNRNMQAQNSSTAKSTTNIRTLGSDLPPPVLPRKTHSNLHPSSLSDETSFNPLLNYMSTNQCTVTKESHTTSSVTTHKTVTIDTVQDQDVFVKSVLQKGDYFVKYNNWHEFRGSEETKKCSNKVIERNENIWEMIGTEYKFLKMLISIRDVYCSSYPYASIGSAQPAGWRASSASRSEYHDSSNRASSIFESKEQSNQNIFENIDSILPGIQQMIEYHAKMSDVLIDNHVIRPDRVITEIGRVLHESIPDNFIPVLAELYGCINFVSKFINEKMTNFKRYPEFQTYIQKCERDPRTSKKSISDILLYMSTHWSRKATTLASIINNTINDSHDLNNLLKFKEKIGEIINGASNVMDFKMNMKWLKGTIENYEITPDLEESERAFKFMTADDAKVLFNGKVNFETKKSTNGRLLTREVHGVALEECIFFLQVVQEPGRSHPKYQLFKDRDSSFPALLRWGELYGYFREEDAKYNEAFNFYVIIEKPAPAIVRLSVGTLADRSYWKQYMMKGFSRWQSETSDINEAEKKLNSDLKRIERKWSNTQYGIELIKELDNSLRVQLEYRTVGFRCLLEEELKRLTLSHALNRNNSNSSNSMGSAFQIESKKDENYDVSDSACTETFLPDLTTKEGVHDWLEVFIEWVNRLKFSLCSSGANITRSASEIEARKRPSIPTVKKCETFSGRDSPNSEKRQTDVTFLNPPITKQKKDQRRISVSGFTNLFRINSKTVKHDDSSKSVLDSGILPETNLDSEKDQSTLETLDMISETDCFLMGLSKDTVTAFNEINIAAKNITSELINLRAKNVGLEAEIKKIQEENQSYCDFLRKYHKGKGDNQSSVVSSGHIHQKSDSGSLGGVGSGNGDQLSEGIEVVNENSAHIDQKTIECRRQTEALREMYKQFENEKKKWEKEYDTQRTKNRSDSESLFEKRRQLDAEKEALAEKENKYRVKCLMLQEKIDKFNSTYNIDLEVDSSITHMEVSTLPNIKVQQLIHTQPHSRSQSDDTSHKRISKINPSSAMSVSPPLASTEATLYNADQSRHMENVHISNIPDQLKGSLVNQERQSQKTNSSDNILETKGISSGSSSAKSKMTPTTDRKEIYSSSNMCYTRDDKDKECSSDVDEFGGSTDRLPKKSTTIDIFEKKYIKTTVTKTSSLVNTDSKIQDRNSTIAHASSDTTGAKPLGIPVGLASKSKKMPKKAK